MQIVTLCVGAFCVFILATSAYAAQEECANDNLQGISGARACVDKVGCYFDGKADDDNVLLTCLNAKPDCLEIADEEDDPEVWGGVYGYSPDAYGGKGRVRIEDYCLGNDVYQVRCRSDHQAEHRRAICDFGCRNGVCIEDEDDEEIENVRCTDSDGARVYYEEGFTHERQFQHDACLDKVQLRESYCDKDGLQKATIFTCPSGCEAGKCKPIDIQIEQSIYNEAGDEVLLTLDKTPLSVLSLRHELRRDAGPIINTGLNYSIDGDSITIQRISDALSEDELGEGSFTLTLAMCPESGEFTGDGITSACGISKTISLYYKPPRVSSSSVSSTVSSTQSSSQTVSSMSSSIDQNIENPFPDTDMSVLSGKAAAELYSRSVIRGFPDGDFKGGELVNRAEAAKMIVLLRLGEPESIEYRGRFTDVSGTEWFAPYITAAANAGIIEGHPDGTFRPADTVNTAELLAMIVRAFGLEKEKLQYRYIDVSPEDWFADFAGIAELRQLFPDRDIYLMPSTPLMRNDVVVALYQYLRSR